MSHDLGEATDSSAFADIVSTAVAAVEAGVRIVYFLLKDGEIVYVGRTSHLYLRLAQHQVDGTKDFDSYAFIRTSRPHDLEARAIKELSPKYNRMQKTVSDDPDIKMRIRILRKAGGDRAIARRLRTTPAVLEKIRRAPRSEGLKLVRRLRMRTGVKVGIVRKIFPPYVTLRANGRFTAKICRIDGTRPCLGHFSSAAEAYEAVLRVTSDEPTAFSKMVHHKLAAWTEREPHE